MAGIRTLSAIAPSARLEAVGLAATRWELGRARILCRAWSQTVPETRRTREAALFVRCAVEAFARQIAPKLCLSESQAKPFGRLDHAAKQLAAEIGRDAAQLPLVEGLHFVTSLYPALLPGHERSALGAFYTPLALCNRLLDQATEAGVNWQSAKVLDPAAGGGIFLI